MESIPLYDLPKEQLLSFGFKLYHLKGQHSHAGELSSIPFETHIPHRHKFYEICIFTTGGGIHEVDFHAHAVKPLSIHFISPGQVHLLSGTDENQGYILAFTADFIAGNMEDTSWLLELPFFNPVQTGQILELDQEAFSYMLTLLRHMASDYRMMGEKARDIVQYYLKVLLLKCNFLFCRQEKELLAVEDISLKMVSRFKQLIENHFQKLHQVQQYSDLLHISPAHLNKCCKQVTGSTASELIVQRLLLEAKRLLIFTNMSSKEIAYHLQFEDPAYFSRMFRKNTTFSPTAFREAMHEKYQSS